MTKAERSSNFDSYTRGDFVRRILELEDQVERWQPKPAKFKLGQLLFQPAKFPPMRGQAGLYFRALSVEQKADGWHYGCARETKDKFSTIPESKLQALTAEDLIVSLEPPAAVAQAQAGPLVPIPGEYGDVLG